MMARDFCYWLQGFFEVSNTDNVTPEQIKIIKNHLNLTFIHDIDNQYPEDDGLTQDVHDGIAKPLPDLSKKPDMNKVTIPEKDILKEKPSYKNNYGDPDGPKMRC